MPTNSRQRIGGNPMVTLGARRKSSKEEVSTSSHRYYYPPARLRVNLYLDGQKEPVAQRLLRHIEKREGLHYLERRW